MKEVGHTHSTPRLTGRRRGKPKADSLRPGHPTLEHTVLPTSRADQRPSVLIVGSCQSKVFVADDVLIYAETLHGEETVRAWLVQHGIHMAPPSSKTAPTDKGPNGATRS